MNKYTGVLLYDDSYDESEFRISPSGVEKFFSHTNIWYRENLMKEKHFLGNTSTVLGTCVHYLNEKCLGTYDEYSKAFNEVRKYVTSFDWNIEVDQDKVFDNFEEMHEAFLPYIKDHKPDYSEMQVSTPITDGVVAAGTIDAYNSETGVLTDYKTYSSKTKPKSISTAYRYQMLVYAYILHRNGYIVNQMDVVYVNRRAGGGISDKGNKLKAYPPEATVLSEPITSESLLFIEGILELIAASAVKFIKNPNMRYLLAQDYRLKGVNSCAYNFQPKGL